MKSILSSLVVVIVAGSSNAGMSAFSELKSLAGDRASSVVPVVVSVESEGGTKSAPIAADQLVGSWASKIAEIKFKNGEVGTGAFITSIKLEAGGSFSATDIHGAKKAGTWRIENGMLIMASGDGSEMKSYTLAFKGDQLCLSAKMFASENKNLLAEIDEAILTVFFSKE